MVTELKERQEKQVTPASREETINRLDVIEQRISEMQGKSGIPENMVQEILNQIGSIRKGQSENQKQDLEDIKGLIVTSHRYFKERLKVLFPADDTPTGETTPVSWQTLPQSAFLHGTPTASAHGREPGARLRIDAGVLRRTRATLPPADLPEETRPLLPSAPRLSF